MPITLSDSKLVATMSDGHMIRDQHKIGNASFGKTSRPKLQLEPASKLTQDAKEAILDADIVVIAQEISTALLLQRSCGRHERGSQILPKQKSST